MERTLTREEWLREADLRLEAACTHLSYAIEGSVPRLDGIAHARQMLDSAEAWLRKEKP